MLDMHTHILPNVDDGSKSLDISRRLLLQEINQGITKIILTTHQNKNNLDKNGLIEKFNSFKDDVED
jgi:protein-tyrosine phosphatase